MQEFTAKRNALFACLDDASKEIKGTILDQDRPRNTLKRNRGNQDSRQSLSFLRGKESIFKKPELPITRCLKARRTPDYQANPHKWKKYNLSDVDISDHTNTSAAFAFLNQMDEQHNTTYDQDAKEGASSSRTKIEFKKSSKISRKIRSIESEELCDAEIDKPKLKGSKLVMPEYVVGEKKIDKKRKRTKEQNVQRTRAAGFLKLTHLQENDDGESDDDDKMVAER